MTNLRVCLTIALAISVSCGCSGSESGDEPGAGGGGKAGAGGSAGKGSGGTAGGGGASAGTAGSSGSGGGQSGSGGSSGGNAGGSGGQTPGSGGSGGSGGSVPDPSCGSHKWACWPMPNPTGSGLPNEASYTSQGDGTVLDGVTGLVWQEEAPDETFTWDAAIAYCEGLSLGGADDWRLPTRIEMTSVVDYAKSGSKFAAGAFPGASGGFHKTASDWILTINQQGAGAGRDFAWAFNMSDGIVSNAYSKATAARLRCVRGGGAGEGPSEPAVEPPDHYTVIAAGEVRDNYTGLIWQSGDSDAGMTWQEAVDYCATLGLNGNTWRLPSIREAATLVDEALVAPSINREMFPGTAYGARSNDWYWASHRAQGNDSAAWAINFDDGFTGFNAGASGAWNYFTSAFARCVR